MFKNKNLVAFGCSHTFGSLLDDNDPVTSFPRSWVHKLSEMTNASGYENFAIPGGSNDRSFRLLLNYIFNNTKDDFSNDVVLIGLTATSRFERFVKETEFDKKQAVYDHGLISIDNKKFATVRFLLSELDRLEMDEDYRQYIKIHYEYFSEIAHELDSLAKYLELLSCFLKSKKIEHYFLGILGCEYINLYSKDLPFIWFEDHNDRYSASSFAGLNGVGAASCGHLDHDGNQFLAEYIHKKILEIKNGT